jgi:Na+/proline symporter
MLYAFFQHYPLTEELEQVNRVLPIFIVREMPAGISGLVIAAIFAAAMSTLSSSLNSLSSSSVNDFYRQFVSPDAPASHFLKASRFMTLGWGVVLIGVSMLARHWGEVLQAGLTIAGLTMGSVLGIFLLGAFARGVQETAAFWGMISGLVVMLLVGYATDLAWTWYVLIGTTVTTVTGVAAQKLLGAEVKAD